jgi:hypothetical protein
VFLIKNRGLAPQPFPNSEHDMTQLSPKSNCTNEINCVQRSGHAARQWEGGPFPSALASAIVFPPAFLPPKLSAIAPPGYLFMPSTPRPKKARHLPQQKEQSQKHPIRIVPLHAPEVIAAQPAAHLTYRNGPLLTSVEVFTIFWGAAWEQSPASDLVTQMNGFFDFVLTSALMDQLAEYSTAADQIGHGKRIGTVTLDTPAPPKTVQDSAIQSFIQQEILSGTLPQPNANTLYFVFLPDGVTVEQGGSASCKSFCGYHDSFGANIYYAVMPYPGCQGCIGGLAPFDALTSTSSHELCEAITDPIPGQGWYDDNNGEIGDICAWKTKQLGNYTVQLEWSNAANACT